MTFINFSYREIKRRRNIALGHINPEKMRHFEKLHSDQECEKDFQRSLYRCLFLQHFWIQFNIKKGTQQNIFQKQKKNA